MPNLVREKCYLEVAGNLWVAVCVRVYKVLIAQQPVIATYWLVQFFSQGGVGNAFWQKTTKYIGENSCYFRCICSQ